MQPQQCWRIDLGELKALIVKTLGSNKSKHYFYYLNRFLSQKLSKNEFNKSCIQVLGRENIEIHNRFIHSILKNVSQAKAPPPISNSNPNPSAANSSSREDGCEQRGGILPNHNQSLLIWSNGFVPPPSHKSRSIPPPSHKSRSKTRDQKLNDGQHEKRDYLSGGPMCAENIGSMVSDNGTIIPCDYRRPLEHLHSVAAQLPEDKLEGAALRTDEKPSINNESQLGAALVKDGEEPDELNSFERPLLAPLGIPVWLGGMGGRCKSMPILDPVDFSCYFNSGGLYDAETLRKRMEQIAISQDLGGVSTECGNVLNNVMDVYLKRLVRSCVELVGARSTYQSSKHHTHKQQKQGNPINGILANSHFHMQNGSEPADVQEQKQQYSISLLDFKVAMELNPKQLGGDWPLRLEKICMHPLDKNIFQ